MDSVCAIVEYLFPSLPTCFNAFITAYFIRIRTSSNTERGKMPDAISKLLVKTPHTTAQNYLIWLVRVNGYT